MDIQLKRIYEPAAPEDGFRVLVDRLWPRGVKKDGARIDLWAKDIAPTAGLRQDYHGGLIPWPVFSEKYRLELQDSPALDDFVQTIKGKEAVTLLFAGKDTDHTHVKVLLEALNRRLAR